MFEIRYGDKGEIVIAGRYDAAQADRAAEFMAEVSESRVVDLKDLTYISSAGLACLLWTQKRLMDAGHRLKLVNVSKHIHDVLRYTSFQQVFEIETAEKGERSSE